jgi:FAD/FMN-containing dehydrogenase
MLDLSPMKGIQIDPVRRTAQAQAGLTLGEFDHETQAFGLATTLGIVSVTGIAGLTLGGGLGWLNGKHGLACDNLLSPMW